MATAGQLLESGVVAKGYRRVKSLTVEAQVIHADGSLGEKRVQRYIRPFWLRVLDWIQDQAGAVLQVNTGRAVVTALLAGGTTYPKWIGWGTGAGVTAATDTTLFTEDSGGSPVYARVSGTQTQVTTSTLNDTYQCVGTITANAVKTITNAGIFDALTVGDLYVKGDFSGIPLSTNDSIQFTFQVQYS